MTWRKAVWWTVALLLLIPALLSGLALHVVNQADAVLTRWWDDFGDWAGRPS